MILGGRGIWWEACGCRTRRLDYCIEDRVVLNAVMSDQDLPSLIAAQRRLLMEKNVILEMLKQVRNEMQKLQVK
jgi:hypothetical protein